MAIVVPVIVIGDMYIEIWNNFTAFMELLIYFLYFYFLNLSA